MAATKPSVMFCFSDLHHREALSPEVAQLSLSPDTTLYPSPPLSVTLTTGIQQKPLGVRARRLRLSHTTSEHLPDLRRGDFSGSGAATGDTDLASQRVQQQMADLLPLPAHKPHPPLASALGNGLLDSWYGI